MKTLFKITRYLPLVMILFSLNACVRDALTDVGKKGDPVMDAQTKATAVQPLALVHSYEKIFDGGTGIYHSFRIPSLVRTTNGTLIAFAEGRRWSPGDFGDINLVFKRSTNNGSSWSALGEVVGSGAGTWGNPTAVVDQNSGRVWLFMSWNSADITKFGDVDTWGERRVYLSYSDDNGATWSTPKDMTSTLLPANYKWDAMGPGAGIQTQKGPHPGRLIIPALGRNIYSDDHGATWKYALIPSGTDEGTVVELSDGKLMRNDRPGTDNWEINKRRHITTGSIESGFSAFYTDNTLLDPKCEGSIFRYTDAPNRILFLNSASTITRTKMRIRISYNNGATWPVSRRIYDWLTDDQAHDQGKGGYSSLGKTADNMVGALIEINEDISNNSTSSKSIEFHKFNLSWILNGATEPI